MDQMKRIIYPLIFVSIVMNNGFVAAESYNDTGPIHVGEQWNITCFDLENLGTSARDLIRWRRNNHSIHELSQGTITITNDNATSSSILRFLSATQTHEGCYTCIKQPKQKHCIKVIDLKEPVMTFLTENVPLRGFWWVTYEYLSFPINCSKGNETIGTIEYGTDKILTTTIHGVKMIPYGVNGTMLFAHRARRNHSGVYSCINQPSGHRIFDLKVNKKYYETNFGKMTNKTLEVRQGQKWEISCGCNLPDYLKTNFWWKKNGKIIREISSGDITVEINKCMSTLTSVYARPSHSGKYTCTPIDTGYLNLKVLAP